MNIKNIQRVRNVIEAHPDQYDQEDFFHDCGTPSCIAGHAVFHRDYAIALNRSVYTIARDQFGISSTAAKQLFHGAPYGVEELPPTPAEALGVLDHLIETGEVKWPIRMAGAPKIGENDDER